MHHHWQRLTPVFALLILGLVGAGCDSSGLSGLNNPGAEGQATTNQGPGQAGPPGDVSGGPPVSTPGDGDSADVRVAHLSPDAPGVDVYVGKAPDGNPTIGGLAYSTFAPNRSGDYLSLASGTYDIAVTPAPKTSPRVIDTSLTLAANKDYTVLAIGELSPEGGEPGIQARPLVDNADEDSALPPRDKTLVRFVHASPDAGAVNIAVDGATVLSNVTFGTSSGYVEAEPGKRTIEVQKNGTAVLKRSDFPLTAGEKITVYVIGNAVPENGEASLSAVPSLEATNPAGTGSFVDRDDEENDDEESEEYSEHENEDDE
ncbi:MAG: DUF4397 domain-containing protein [Salinibacter sp.]